jgi:uncharacterized protein (TIGR03085 family)
MTLAQSERAALADLFAELGPDQPTLCEGWQTRDLLVHLIIRERRPDAAVGTAVKPLEGWTKKVAAGYADRPWTELIEEYRTGPQKWNPMRWSKVDELANGGEMFIHHEDARRGQPGWAPRTFDEDTTQTLIGMIDSPLSRLAVRKSPVGVVAEVPGGRTIQLKSGEPAVTLNGEPGEILLWLSGRRACRVELKGEPQAVDALNALQRGI